jgi:predicted lactoylglutathione lyase
MKIDDIRVFVPCKNYQQSCAFYQAMGFNVEQASADLSIATSGECSFFYTNRVKLLGIYSDR